MRLPIIQQKEVNVLPLTVSTRLYQKLKNHLVFIKQQNCDRLIWSPNFLERDKTPFVEGLSFRNTRLSRPTFSQFLEGYNIKIAPDFFKPEGE